MEIDMQTIFTSLLSGYMLGLLCIFLNYRCGVRLVNAILGSVSRKNHRMGFLAVETMSVFLCPKFACARHAIIRLQIREHGWEGFQNHNEF